MKGTQRQEKLLFQSTFLYSKGYVGFVWPHASGSRTDDHIQASKVLVSVSNENLRRKLESQTNLQQINLTAL